MNPLRSRFLLVPVLLAVSTGVLPAQTIRTIPAPILGDAPRLGNAVGATVPSRRYTNAYGDASYGLVVAPTQREQSRLLFATVYQASENMASDWTGSVSQGIAGSTSQSFKDSIALRINYFRAMAGIPAAVTLSFALSASDQQAALMMSANGQLSHSPPPSWKFYTADGANAAGHSNLNLGSDGPSAINSYIQDAGSNNGEVGHRRWVLYPPTNVMGTGDVDPTDNSAPASNVLWVVGGGSASSSTSRDSFVAWPPPGYVPYSLVFPRWSFAYAGADFTGASVTVTRGGQTVPLHFSTTPDGFGDNTLVWVPDGLDPDALFTPTAPAQEVPTVVTVSNVLVGGASRSFTYSVTPFDPALPGVDVVTPVVGGPVQAAIGGLNIYNFTAVPDATGYRWQYSTLSPLTLDLDAESASDQIVVTPGGENPITTARAAHGSASYRLTSEPAHTLAPGSLFIPAAGSTLAFNSQLGYATSEETARAQISTDGGTTWSDLYTLTGNNGQAESGFSSHTVDLGPYAGMSCLVRFQYAHASTGSYFVPVDGVGWFLDDIAISGAQALSDPVSSDVPAGLTQFSFTPAMAGDYALQVTPVFFGQYEADGGKPMVVQAGVVGVGPQVTLSVTTPQVVVGSGGKAVFTLNLSEALASDLVVNYTVKGSAVNGTDYVRLKGSKKIKAGLTARNISVFPLGDLGGASKKAVKLVLAPGVGYTVIDAAPVKVKIVGAGN